MRLIPLFILRVAQNAILAVTERDAAQCFYLFTSGNVRGPLLVPDSEDRAVVALIEKIVAISDFYGIPSHWYPLKSQTAMCPNREALTQSTTDYMHFGTNFLIALTFTPTDVGYGANLFYYIGGSGITVTNYTTNSVSGVGLTPTNTVTAIGWSICQPDGQPVTATADCVGPIIPVVLDIGTTID